MTGVLRHTRQSDLPLGKNTAHAFAAQHALVDFKTGNIFSFIPKNGCTTLRYSLALANGAIDGPEGFEWIHRNNRAFAASLPDLVRAQHSMVILRCAHARLASVFLDKFVTGRGTPAARFQDAIAPRTLLTRLRRKLGLSTPPQDITFRDFVRHLASDPALVRLNIHWRQQVDFLVYADYDLWVPLHRLDEMRDTIRERTGLTLHDTRAIARHDVSRLERVPGACADTPISALRALRGEGQGPDHANLYDPDLIAAVARIYAKDLALYRERFGEDGLLFPAIHP